MSGGTRERPIPSSGVDADVALVNRITSGCTDSWHEFVYRYSRLIYAVLHQQLVAEDIDAVHTVFVDTLKYLYDEKLRKYEGRATLSTWIVLVTRGQAVDYLRRKGGRRRMPVGYDSLSDVEKEVFKYVFVEGLSYEAAIHALKWTGLNCSVEQIAHAVLNIEDKIDRRYLERLDHDRQARECGAATGAELEYHLYARARYEGSLLVNRADREMIESEADALRARIGDLCRRLPEKERKLIELRFGAGWTAAKIAKQLDMQSQRQVYSLTNTVLNKLRRLLGAGYADGGVPNPDE